MPTLFEEKTEIKKPVRLQDVARAAGISLATASLALNGKGRVSLATQQEVRRIAQEMGFEADLSAQRLAAGQSNTQIGLFTRTLDMGVATRKLQLLQGQLFEKGFRASIHSSGHYQGSQIADHAALIRDLRLHRLLAIVCYAAHQFDKPMHEELEKYITSGGHLVTFDLQNDLPCDQVIFDRADSADKAVTHLLELGHREIGFAMPGIHSDTMRLPGLYTALARYDLPLNKEFLFDCKQGLPPEVVGERLAHQFLALKQRPTAICIPDDMIAASFIATLYRQGLHVPQDVSVISHDNLPIAAHNFVPLTTVTQPMEDIARSTVELLTSRLDGSYSGSPRKTVLYGELIVRQSTTPLDIPTLPAFKETK
jgi:DNA-binding LacI/PurR family transcriptional regulator